MSEHIFQGYFDEKYLSFLDKELPIDQTLFCPTCYSFRLWAWWRFPKDSVQEPLNAIVNCNAFHRGRDAPHKELAYIECVNCQETFANEQKLLSVRMLPEKQVIIASLKDKLRRAYHEMIDLVVAYPVENKTSIKMMLRTYQSDVQRAIDMLDTVKESYKEMP